jgi:hypothetical protein
MTAMITIALQSPWPAAAPRVEKPVQSAHALPPVSTVAALPDGAAKSMMPDEHLFRERARESFRFQQSQGNADAAPETAPQPFPDMRFADPLPDLPELDLPAKAQAWQSALTALRGDDKT